MARETRSASEADPKPGVGDLSYAAAGVELDRIIEEFETGVVDVDRLVEQLERATDIVDELDRRLRRTRLQVEELVPRLEAIGARDASTTPVDSSEGGETGSDDAEPPGRASGASDGEPGGLF
jgi:exonuclease VII small subunit